MNLAIFVWALGDLVGLVCLAITIIAAAFWWVWVQVSAYLEARTSRIGAARTATRISQRPCLHCGGTGFENWGTE